MHAETINQPKQHALLTLYIRMLSRFQNKGTFRHVLQVDNKHIKMVSFVPSNFVKMQSHGVNKRQFWGCTPFVKHTRHKFS